MKKILLSVALVASSYLMAEKPENVCDLSRIDFAQFKEFLSSDGELVFTFPAGMKIPFKCNLSGEVMSLSMKDHPPLVFNFEQQVYLKLSDKEMFISLDAENWTPMDEFFTGSINFSLNMYEGEMPFIQYDILLNPKSEDQISDELASIEFVSNEEIAEDIASDEESFNEEIAIELISIEEAEDIASVEENSDEQVSIELASNEEEAEDIASVEENSDEQLAIELASNEEEAEDIASVEEMDDEQVAIELACNEEMDDIASGEEIADEQVAIELACNEEMDDIASGEEIADEQVAIELALNEEIDDIASGEEIAEETVANINMLASNEEEKISNEKFYHMLASDEIISDDSEEIVPQTEFPA